MVVYSHKCWVWGGWACPLAEGVMEVEEGGVEGTYPAGCCCLKDHSSQYFCWIRNLCVFFLVLNSNTVLWLTHLWTVRGTDYYKYTQCLFWKHLFIYASNLKSNQLTMWQLHKMQKIMKVQVQNFRKSSYQTSEWSKSVTMWLWSGHRYLYQMGCFKYFINCWFPGNFTHKNLKSLELVWEDKIFYIRQILNINALFTL